MRVRTFEIPEPNAAWFMNAPGETLLMVPKKKPRCPGLSFKLMRSVDEKKGKFEIKK